MACNGQIQFSTRLLSLGTDVLGTPTSPNPLTGFLGPVLTSHPSVKFFLQESF